MRKFDGRKGNPREHIVSYIDENLREFSKSLTDKAYSWFVNLPANSIKDWDELVNAFCTKFFIATPKVEIADLSKDPQRKDESPFNYVARLKERALDCKDVISETSLVGIYVSGLQSKYRLHIENHITPNFFELMIQVKNTEASVSEADREEFYGGARKWGNKPPFLEKKRKKEKIEVNVVEQRSRDREIRTKIPLERYQINAWIEDGQLKLKPIERQPTPEEKRDPKYCMFHRTIGHSNPDCYSVRRLYHSKVQKGEIVQTTEKNPVPSHKPVLTYTAVEENS